MDGVNPDSSAQDRIAGAILSLIAERGLAGVTMAAVAREAGVARQTLYNHFPDVESIVISVIEQHERRGSDQVRRLLEGQIGAAAKLEQLIRHSVVMGSHGRALTALDTSLSPQAQETLRAHRDRAAEMIEEILEAGVTEGVFRSNLEPEVDAGFIREILVSGSDLDESVDVAVLAEATVRFVMAAVGVNTG